MAELTVGTEFTSTEDAIACVNRYNEFNSTKFVIRSRTNRALLYRCRHGIKRTSRCKSVRPKQQLNFVGCEATIRMYISTNGSVKVTQLNLNHLNHVVQETLHRFYINDPNDKDIDTVRTPIQETNIKKEIFDEDTNINEHHCRDVSNEVGESGEEISAESRDLVIPREMTDENEIVSLTHDEKHEIIMPLLGNIATLVSCHSTNNFLKYFKELKGVEEKVRRGESLSSEQISSTSTLAPSPSSDLPGL